MTKWSANVPAAISSTDVFCLVGNVAGERVNEKGEKVSGTKHFSPNTKVWCFPPLWGDGYEFIKVIGRHRKSRGQICLIMPSKFITNWKVKKVYDPYVLKILRAERAWESKEDVLRMAESLSKR